MSHISVNTETGTFIIADPLQIAKWIRCYYCLIHRILDNTTMSNNEKNTAILELFQLTKLIPEANKYNNYPTNQYNSGLVTFDTGIDGKFHFSYPDHVL